MDRIIFLTLDLCGNVYVSKDDSMHFGIQTPYMTTLNRARTTYKIETIQLNIADKTLLENPRWCIR
jgi:hypothetical protein